MGVRSDKVFPLQEQHIRAESFTSEQSYNSSLIKGGRDQLIHKSKKGHDKFIKKTKKGLKNAKIGLQQAKSDLQLQLQNFRKVNDTHVSCDQTTPYHMDDCSTSRATSGSVYSEPSDCLLGPEHTDPSNIELSTDCPVTLWNIAPQNTFNFIENKPPHSNFDISLFLAEKIMKAKRQKKKIYKKKSLVLNRQEEDNQAPRKHKPSVTLNGTLKKTGTFKLIQHRWQSRLKIKIGG